MGRFAEDEGEWIDAVIALVATDPRVFIRVPPNFTGTSAALPLAPRTKNRASN